MANKFSGVTAVAYSTNGSTFTTIEGKIAADSEITPEIITNESTQSTVYGGETLNLNIGFYDFSAYSTLATAMRTNTDYFIRLTFVDGSTETSSEAHPIRVRKVLSANKRDGLNTWRLETTFSTDGEVLTSA